jgi:hypothetical protein
MLKTITRSLSIAALSISSLGVSGFALADGYAEVGANILPQPFSIYASLGYNQIVAPNVIAGGSLDAKQSLGTPATTSLQFGVFLRYYVTLYDADGIYAEVSFGPELNVYLVPSFTAELGLKGVGFLGARIDENGGVYGGIYAYPLRLDLNSGSSGLKLLPSSGLFVGVYYTVIEGLKLEAGASLGFGNGIDFETKFTATLAVGGGFNVGGRLGYKTNFSFGTSNPILQIFAVYKF